MSNYEEIEWYQFEQLVESITMQPGGGREAIEAIRKKLKHGTTQQQLRVLEVSLSFSFLKKKRGCVTL